MQSVARKCGIVDECEEQNGRDAEHHERANGRQRVHGDHDRSCFAGKAR
jgi:hypothetical protein